MKQDTQTLIIHKMSNNNVNDVRLRRIVKAPIRLSGFETKPPMGHVVQLVEEPGPDSQCRQRAKNWQSCEIKTLVDKVCDSYDILFGKNEGMFSSQRKLATWNQIQQVTDKVCPDTHRSLKDCRSKWKHTKSEAKLKHAEWSDAVQQSAGRGSPPIHLDEVYHKIVRVFFSQESEIAGESNTREQKALTPPVAARSTDVTWDNGYYGNVDDEVDDEESYEENVQSVQSHSPSPESSTEPPSKKHKRHEDVPVATAVYHMQQEHLKLLEQQNSVLTTLAHNNAQIAINTSRIANALEKLAAKS